jgi:processive 1,2-diacylglycerol beta-glucosyltransferase
MSRKPRVLLLSASSGAGHVRAAQALEKALAARGDCIVEHIDAIKYVSKLFQNLYDKTYISMVRTAPELMGVLYERTDQPWQHPRRRLALDRLNAQPMIRLLKRIQPDLCVATHFLPAEILAWLIAKKKLQAKNAIVVTDYDVHAMWLCRTVSRYYVAIPEAAEYLSGIGVPREIVRVTGIPIDPLFATHLDRPRSSQTRSCRPGDSSRRWRLRCRPRRTTCSGSPRAAEIVATGRHRRQSRESKKASRRNRSLGRHFFERKSSPSARRLYH